MTADTTAEQSLFDRPIEVPEELASRAQAKGWPDNLVERALRFGYDGEDIDEWLSDDRLPVSEIEKWVGWRERLRYGTIRVREATWHDEEALANMYANAPEDAGDWEVIVERSPYPFAQFRLQEHVNILVVEDRGVILASYARSARNSIVAGKRISVNIETAWRVRRECRGQGYSRLLQISPASGTAWWSFLFYWYMRSSNEGGPDWLRSLRKDLEHKQREGPEPPGIPVSVHHIGARPFDGDATGIRPARRSATRRCVPLINRTHRGLDLFRPYTPEFLRGRLDDPMWGPKPDSWIAVYNWDDYFVLEEEGRIVACAGLWDCGRHMREVWIHKTTGERLTTENTGLMDFGYAEGREDAMARLLGFLIGRTAELGRQELLAPIEQLPELVSRMAPYEAEPETRRLAVHPETGKNADMKVRIIRPYTDLAYW